MESIEHWISGEPLRAATERWSDVYDPSTGETTGRVALADEGVVDAAVASASKALDNWSRSSLATRTEVMFEFRRIVGSRRDELARAISSQHGKVHDDALGEVARGLEVVEFSCGIPHLLKGEYSERVATNVDTYSLLQPVGVVAGITPFNFPAMVPMWMFPVALACGNTFVLKPSERDPGASLLLARWLAEAGLPPGAFNVVQGDRVAVDALLAHPDVAAVSSVGSTAVARYIYETAARHGKRVQALGGAKNHMVVLPDADMEAAADAAVGAGYGSTGQRCMAISAIVAVGSAGDALIEAVRERVDRLRVGPATDPEADMGPLVSADARDRVLGYVAAGEEQGARLAVDGRDLKVEGHENGFFVGPCLFDNVTPDMTIYTDEIFGPVLSVVRADSLEDAIEIVNQNPYGNGTAIFTRSGGAAHAFQSEVEVGMVGVNVPIPVPVAYHPFGGWKQSLFGDTHVYGPEGIAFYTRRKVVTARWPVDEGGVRLSFPS
jgi:malonate-semialdehyde dehydrogenase (acetylating)/methylmalonate-semialdehyde dehydrogenase